MNSVLHRLKAMYWAARWPHYVTISGEDSNVMVSISDRNAPVFSQEMAGSDLVVDGQAHPLNVAMAFLTAAERIFEEDCGLSLWQVALKNKMAKEVRMQEVNIDS